MEAKVSVSSSVIFCFVRTNAIAVIWRGTSTTRVCL